MCKSQDYSDFGYIDVAYDDYAAHTRRRPTKATFMVAYQTNASIHQEVPVSDTGMRTISEAVELNLDDNGLVLDLHASLTAALFEMHSDQCRSSDIFVILNAVPNRYAGR